MGSEQMEMIYHLQQEKRDLRQGLDTEVALRQELRQRLAEAEALLRKVYDQSRLSCWTKRMHDELREYLEARDGG